MTKKFFLLISALLTITLTVSARRVGVFCQMAATGTQISEDGNIRASIVIDSEGEAVLEIENLTDKVMFIHRKRSFSLVNGISEPMYLRQYNTESHTTQQSVITENNTFNTKTIDSESHTNSHTIYDQRVLPIAPHGRSLVYVWDRLPDKLRKDVIEIGDNNSLYRNCIGYFLDTGKKFRKGDRRYYTAENTPLMLVADVEYSFNEKGEDSHRLTLRDYVSSIQIGSAKGVGDDGWLNANSCFAFTSGNSSGWLFFEGAHVALSVLAVVGCAIPLAML